MNEKLLLLSRAQRLWHIAFSRMNKKLLLLSRAQRLWHIAFSRMNKKKTSFEYCPTTPSYWSSPSKMFWLFEGYQMKRTWDILEEIYMNWKMCMDLSCPENGLSPGLCLIGPNHTTSQLVPTYTHPHTHKHTYTNIFNVSEQNTIYIKVRYIPTTIHDCPKCPSLVGCVAAA